jgi:hypothetical protein
MKRAKTQSPKPLSYYELVERFETSKKSCVLCQMESEAVLRYFDVILNEMVNDPGIRAQLLDTGGYCARHAHILATRGYPHAKGILYADQVRRALETLERFPARNQDSCPACEAQLECRSRLIKTLLTALSDETSRGAYEQSSGLCMPHFALVLNSTSDSKIRQCLLETQRKVLSDLLAQMEEFCRKHDYRFSNETFGKERDSWIRAIDMMAGEKDIF